MAATNLILSGALDAVPDLNVCISHGGGFFPYQFGRVEAFAQLNPNNNAKKPLREYLSQIYFDNLIHEVSARQFLVDWMCADNVIGTASCRYSLFPYVYFSLFPFFF